MYQGQWVKKVFASNTIDIDFLQTSSKIASGAPRSRWIKVQSASDLNGIASRASHSKRCKKIIIIPQEYSWGRLQITESGFRHLVNIANAPAAFLAVISAYGVKTQDDERAFYGFVDCESSRQAKPTAPVSEMQRPSLSSFEFCYNVPYVAPHLRQLDDPWSLRQSAAYVRQSDESDHDVYVIINPREGFKKHVTALLEGADRCHLAFHVDFVAYLAEDWVDYIEYLSKQVQLHDNRAQYSNIDDTEQSAYTISYRDLQDLHVLQAKVERACYCVRSCVTIGQKCYDQIINNCYATLTPQRMGCFEHSKAMRTYIATMSQHVTGLERLCTRLHNIQTLLASGLVHHNSRLLQTSNHSSAKALAALFSLTAQGAVQQEVLTSLLGNAQADSRLLKHLSMMATICLPASLVASVFSSSLIQSVPVLSASSTVGNAAQVSGSSGSSGSGHLVLSQQFWTYIAITIPLMLLMLFWMLFLDRRAYQQAEKARLLCKQESREDRKS